MNKRIKKKKLKQWIKNNVKITYSVERLDNGCCKLYAIISAIISEQEQQESEHGKPEE